MRTSRLPLGIGLALCVAVCAAHGSKSSKSSGGPYRVYWHTVDNGGGQSQRDSYRVTGSVGQPDAGAAQGGIYRVRSGFWPLAPAQSGAIFRDGFE
jgi:hypothetical protein